MADIQKEYNVKNQNKFLPNNLKEINSDSTDSISGIICKNEKDILIKSKEDNSGVDKVFLKEQFIQNNNFAYGFDHRSLKFLTSKILEKRKVSENPVFYDSSFPSTNSPAYSKESNKSFIGNFVKEVKILEDENYAYEIILQNIWCPRAKYHRVGSTIGGDDRDNIYDNNSSYMLMNEGYLLILIPNLLNGKNSLINQYLNYNQKILKPFKFNLVEDEDFDILSKLSISDGYTDNTFNFTDYNKTEYNELYNLVTKTNFLNFGQAPYSNVDNGNLVLAYLQNQEFQTTVAYSSGTLIRKQGLLYRFRTAHSIGDWNGNEVNYIPEYGFKYIDIQNFLEEGMIPPIINLYHQGQLFFSLIQKLKFNIKNSGNDIQFFTDKTYYQSNLRTEIQDYNTNNNYIYNLPIKLTIKNDLIRILTPYQRDEITGLSRQKTDYNTSEGHTVATVFKVWCPDYNFLTYTLNEVGGLDGTITATKIPDEAGGTTGRYIKFKYNTPTDKLGIFHITFIFYFNKGELNSQATYDIELTIE